MVPKVMLIPADPGHSKAAKPITRRAAKPAAVSDRTGRGLASVAYGTVVFVDHPILKKSGRWRVRLASIDDLPAGGAPKLFHLFAESAETPCPAHALGTVVLRRVSEDHVIAVNGDDEHAGSAAGSACHPDNFDIEVIDREVWAHVSE